MAVVSGLGAAAAAVGRRRYVAVTVSGASMEPSFHHGDRVLVRRGRTGTPGQVVVAEHPVMGRPWAEPPLSGSASVRALAGRSWMIKRVVAVEGDPVPRLDVLAAAGEGRVPPGSLVLIGDNAEASADSRFFGYFPAERVLGVAVRRLG
ncbi:S26 family signal peptidase [Actinocorallia longicatena]|uniref:S26 family signal peptidase n=1 Tax=Actinocorallia longicatena TaxID=111803 RepID=A0ABP6Q9J4_9ACTN